MRKIILDVLFEAYNKSADFDNAGVKADFAEVYLLMNRKSLKEIDEVIYAVCTLCREHEKAGFIEGIKVGFSLFCEVNKKGLQQLVLLEIVHFPEK